MTKTCSRALSLVVPGCLHASHSPDVQGDRVLDPYQLLLEHPDITLVRTPLPPCHMGRWYPEYRVIMLCTSLTAAEERSTLLHELGHALGNESGVDDCWLNGKQEKRCHERVARTLIPLDRLILESQWAADEHQLAEALDVDVETVLLRYATLTDAEQAMFLDAQESMEEIA